MSHVDVVCPKCGLAYPYALTPLPQYFMPLSKDGHPNELTPIIPADSHSDKFVVTFLGYLSESPAECMNMVDAWRRFKGEMDRLGQKL